MTRLSPEAYRPRVRTHPRTVGVVVDLLLVATLVTAMLLEIRYAADESLRPTSLVLVALAALPVLLWRHRPVWGLVLGMGTLYLLMANLDIYQTVPLASMVCGYGVALTTDRRRSVLTALALVPFVLGAIWLFGHREDIPPFEVPKNLAFVAAPLVLGSAVRERRAHVRSLLDRAEAAERTREEEALRRVGEERLRIARDVHDVVAHAMVAINVQAGVGAHLLDRDPERARQTLVDIKRVSGEALADLRATLDTIRTPEEHGAAPVRPTQGLADLEDLAHSLRTAGVDVTVHLDPALGVLPAATSTTAFRIAQEALTNVVRHARGATAEVRVTSSGGSVLVEVCDDGRGESVLGAPAPDGTGNGLRGMHERAAAAGGTLEAGPRPEGGWLVRATLPAPPAHDEGVA